MLQCDLRDRVLGLITNYLYNLEKVNLNGFQSLSCQNEGVRLRDCQLGHPRSVALRQACERRHRKQNDLHPSSDAQRCRLQQSNLNRVSGDGRLEGQVERVKHKAVGSPGERPLKWYRVQLLTEGC